MLCDSSKMNGNINGVMDEQTETELPNTDLSTLKKVTADGEIQSNNCENSNDENSHHTDSESSQEPNVDSIQHNGISNNEEPENDTLHANDNAVDTSMKENSDSIIENHCTSSNLSSANSESNSQSNNKSEKDDEPEKESKKIEADNGKDEIHMETEFVNATNCGGSEDEVDSEEDSSDDDEASETSTQPRADDTVSINSDSEGENTSQECQKNKNKIVLKNDVDNDNLNGQGQEVHEILSDDNDNDCVVTNIQSIKAQSQITPRRSSRAIKRKKYVEVEDDLDNISIVNESDVEEIEPEDPFIQTMKPILIKAARDIIDISGKSKPSLKHPIVISKCQGKNISNNVQNLYQSIESRGTTVTPVSMKINNQNTIQNNQPQPQPSILPSLTDDMFVVEAPSFIVPYVYEKPSVKPFREFVDILGKELEDQRAKEEEEKLQKEKEEKEKREKEKQERRDRGEQVEDSETEMEPVEKQTEADVAPDKKKKETKEEKKERRRQRKDDDDASWDGESSSSSEEDEMLSDDDKISTVVIKDKIDDALDIKHVTELTAEKVVDKPDNYFDCSLGKFFINIGLNLVQEYVQNDLLKQQNRKLYREKKTGHDTQATESSIASLKKNLEFSKATNISYKFDQKKCKYCSFKSESSLALAHHLETPHMKNNVYKCNFCTFEIKSPHDILCHMDKEHNIRGKLERAPAYHQCANCPFEDNGKGKLARHLIPCAKKFKPNVNLAPPIDWEPPAKIPKMPRSRNSLPSTSYQSVFNKAVSNMTRPLNVPMMNMGNIFRPRNRGPMGPIPRAGIPVQGVPILGANLLVRQSNPGPVNSSSSFAIAQNTKRTGQPSISITPLPRPPPPQFNNTQSKNSFVICEICDGYIKDLEQLRNHMQWIHKVKIHPKMIYNRPPLNCQKCQFRFFTDQGLERHLLGSHGLVTSSMQEAANKGKDAGRCPVCGRVYQWKLLSHVARDHSLNLKPAHLSYKCTVCTATFGMYKQFENHVYSAHSTVAKRVMDKNKGQLPPPAKSNTLLKPLKINDEITIIPQPVKEGTSKSSEK